ncbi:MAG: RIP metalloprotease RseP [Prevotella sp.]|nr:RIP metalloprotease RseP [Candidatus Prevotella equi]
MSIFLIKALQFILAITILVALHEGGHFFFSKLFGVRVNKFYIFFDYKFSLFSTKFNWWRRLRGKVDSERKVIPAKKNEDGSYEYEGTEYGLGWIPLGGYCQIEGMIDETQHDIEKLKEPAKPWEFRGKPCWQRLLIMIGGVLVNFLLALVIYCGVFFAWGEDYYAVKDMTYGMKFNEQAKELGFKDGDILLRSNDGDFRGFDATLLRNISTATEVTVKREGKEAKVSLPGNLSLLEMLKTDPVFCRPFLPADIDTVIPGTAAAKAGLLKGDKILALGEKNVDSWNEFQYESGRIADALGDCKTKADSLKVLTTSVTVLRNKKDTITANVTLDNEAHVGVGMSTVGDYCKVTHIDHSIISCIPAGIGYAMDMLGGYVSDLKYVFSADGAKQLGGFGAIGSMFPPVWDWYMFWMMTAFLSIILAFMNILPIPALDGGHVLFLLFEMITGKKPGDKFMVYAEYVGMGILFALMFLANLNDILRYFGIMY